jgi:TP901 family phage tail tape measure protein
MATTIPLKFTADPSGAIAGFNRVAGAASSAQAKMRSLMSPKIFSGLSRTAAAQAKFDEFQKPLRNLQSQLGLTTREADKLGQKFIKVGAQLNIPPPELVKLAEAGKRFGAAGFEAGNFAIRVATASKALNIPPGELLKLADIGRKFGYSGDKAIEFGVKVATAQAKLRTFGETLKNIGGKITGVGQSLTTYVTLPILGVGTAATKMAIDLDKQLTAASRALDFDPKQAESFRKSVMGMAPAIGITPQKLAELATEAGKLGISGNIIKDFTQTVAELSMATDTNATELATKLSNIRSVYGSSPAELKKFGAAINYLDDAVGGTTPTILNFTSRLAGVGKVTGFNASQVAAIGATFLKLGRNASDAATGTNTMLLHLSAATRQSKRVKGAFKDLGLTAEQVEQMMRNNPEQGLIQFLKIANSYKGNKLGVLTDIFGKQHAPKVIALAESVHELERAFAIAGDTPKGMAKLDAELKKRLGSSAGQIEVFKASIATLGITIGNAILPAVNKVLTAITPLIQKFGAFAEANPKIVQMGVAFLGVVAIVGPLLVGLGSVISAVGTISGAIATALPFILKVGAFLTTTAVPAVLSAGSAIGGVLLTALTAFGSFLTGTLIPAVGALGTAMIGFIFSPAGAITSAIVGLGVAAYYVWKNWDFLKAKAIEIGNVVKVYLGDAFTRVTQLVQLRAQQVVQVANGMAAGWNRAWGYVGQVLNGWGSSLHSWFSSLVNSAWQWGQGLINGFTQGIISVAMRPVQAVQDIVKQIRAYLPSSPAKLGPLSDLDRTGPGLINTMSQGINASPLVSAITGAMGQARDSITTPQFASATGGNGSVTIVMNNNFGNVSSDVRQSVIEELKKHERELLDLIQRANSRINRGRY